MVNGVCVAVVPRRATGTCSGAGGKGNMKIGCKFEIRTKKSQKEPELDLIEMQICHSAIKVDSYFGESIKTHIWSIQSSSHTSLICLYIHIFFVIFYSIFLNLR